MGIVSTLQSNMTTPTMNSTAFEEEDIDQEESQRNQAEVQKRQLFQLKQALSGITTEHEKLKAEYSSKLSALAEPALHKIEEYSAWIDQKCMNFANVLGKTTEGFQIENQNLKDEMKSLLVANEQLTSELGDRKLKDGEKETAMQKMQQKLDTIVSAEGQQHGVTAATAGQPNTAWFDNDLSANIEIIRVNKALQKALEIIDALKKGRSAS